MTDTAQETRDQTEGAGLVLTRDVEGLVVPTPGVFHLDTAHTRLGFVAKHLMVTKVRGYFADFEGTITIGEDLLLSGAELRARTASITTNQEQRDAHLRSSDFLLVDEFPEMTYRSTEVVARDGATFTVLGDLTIRGVTRPVTLQVELDGLSTNPMSGQQVVAFTARGELDREEFGASWNVGLETGGVLVSRMIQLDIEGEALRR